MTTEAKTKSDRYTAGTYTRFPVVLTQGSGATLFDSDGRTYIDFVSGIAVCNLGHAHPRLIEALKRQAERLWHVSNLYYTEPQSDLAALLVENSFADRVFFCNSGAEANEAAIKIVRKYYDVKGEPDRYRIVTMKDSFHGRTMATLSATGQEKVKKGYDPLLDGFDTVPFNDIDALSRAVGPATCAVMLEPVLGEGGVVCPEPGYLKAVRKLCSEKDLLLILDEIQTGMGRTGKLFAYEHFDVAPDVMTLAKALANGLPMGAMLASARVAEAFGPGSHASTFGGTPIVSATALEVMRIFLSDRVAQRCAETGVYFEQRLQKLKERHAVVEEVRGMGLLLGLKLKIPGDAVVRACLKKGFLINCVQENVLRFVPPLIIETGHIDSLIQTLDEILSGRPS